MSELSSIRSVRSQIIEILRGEGYRLDASERDGMKIRSFRLSIMTTPNKNRTHGGIGSGNIAVERVIEVRVQYPGNANDLSYDMTILDDQDKIISALYGVENLVFDGANLEPDFEGGYLNVIRFRLPDRIEKE